MLYMVECRFTDPAREPAWNTWYGGVRLDELLSVPGFTGSQRFIALTRPVPYYLAVHSIASMAVFGTPEYKAMGGGGFQGYQDCITDWVRKFFTGLDAAPPVGTDECLVLTDAGREAARASPVALTWLEPDASRPDDPVRGIARVARATGEALAAAPPFALDVYAPMQPWRRGTPSRAA